MDAHQPLVCDSCAAQIGFARRERESIVTRYYCAKCIERVRRQEAFDRIEAELHALGITPFETQGVMRLIRSSSIL